MEPWYRNEAPSFKEHVFSAPRTHGAHLYRSIGRALPRLTTLSEDHRGQDRDFREGFGQEMLLKVAGKKG